MKFRLWHVPVRAAAGAFILNSGMGKLKGDDEEVQKALHGMASSAYPQMESMEPRTFTKLLGAGEVALGGALLAPFISPGLAGLGLTAFSGGLLGMYFKIPSMTEADGIRPSHQGLALAKDSWLLAMGLALMIDRTSRRARKAIPGKK